MTLRDLASHVVTAWNHRFSTLLTLGIVFAASLPAQAALVTISTFMGNGADNTVAEESDEEDGSNAVSEGNNGGQLSTYYTGEYYFSYFRNEMIALRFDLSSIPNKSLIQNVTLNLYSFRANLTYPMEIYGVKPSAQDASSGFTAENWTEGAEFEDLPGLDFDGYPVTRGIIPADTSYLGLYDGFDHGIEGALVTFSSPSLDQFLQGLGSANAATLFVAVHPDYLDYLRLQFVSRQGSASQTGVIDGDPGDFAPFLQFTVIPEPASWLLFALGGAMLRWRRRH